MKDFLRQLLTIGVLGATLFALNLFAFTEPTQAPPGGNVPAPLNVGNIGQTKIGGLILNTGGAPIGLIVDKGNVGMGTVNPDPQARLDIDGRIKIRGGSPAADRVLTAVDGSGLAEWRTFVGAGGGTPGITVFNNPGFYTFNVPPGITHVTIEVWGGGGQGGPCPGRTPTAPGGGGGGAGGYGRGIYLVAPGTSHAITIGAGGKNIGDGVNGADGQKSSFSTLISADGGRGAPNPGPGAGLAPGGAGGGSNGQFSVSGGKGEDGWSYSYGDRMALGGVAFQGGSVPGAAGNGGRGVPSCPDGFYSITPPPWGTTNNGEPGGNGRVIVNYW